MGHNENHGGYLIRDGGGKEEAWVSLKGQVQGQQDGSEKGLKNE